MLNMLCNGFSSVSNFFVSVSDVCFKCFICPQMYVANVLFGRFKSRSGVASPSSLSAASPQCLLLLLAPAGHPLPPPPLLDASDVRGSTAPRGGMKRHERRTVRPDVRTLADPFLFS